MIENLLGTELGKEAQCLDLEGPAGLLYLLLSELLEAVSHPSLAEDILWMFRIFF